MFVAFIDEYGFMTVYVGFTDGCRGTNSKVVEYVFSVLLHIMLYHFVVA